MVSRKVLSIGILAVGVLGGITLYAHRNAPPGCTNSQTLNRVSSALHDQLHLDSVVVNNIQTLANGFFGRRYECRADVAQILGGLHASDMHWREIHYSSVRPGSTSLTVVSVTVGPEVPLAPVPLTFWARVRAWL